MAFAALPQLARRPFLRAGTQALLALAGMALGRAHAAPATGPTPPPPAWAPEAPGTLRVLQTSNRFLSYNGGLPGWEHAFGGLVDDYSGGVFNPCWGPYGAMVFHGGGHSATFDNSVVLLDLNDLTFKQVSRPTPALAGRNWADARSYANRIDPALDTVHCEYGDGQPGAGHSYDTLAVLPPQAGGAVCGTLLRVASFAVHFNASCNTGWSHRMDFAATSERNGRWARASRNGPDNYLAPGACSALDVGRRRVWWLASLSSAPAHIRYLDLDSGLQMQVALAPGAALAPPADYDSATLRYAPAHDLLVLTGTRHGALALAYLHCARPQAGWITPELTTPVPVQDNASVGLDWVPEQAAFVLLSPADPEAVYALHVPREPEQCWTATRQPLPAGQRLPTARVVGKRWSYCQAARCFVWMASSTSPVVAYRPLQTKGSGGPGRSGLWHLPQRLAFGVPGLSGGFQDLTGTNGPESISASRVTRTPAK